jgi:hypothetical protein
LFRHIFAVAGTLRVPLSQPQKRHIPPERYVQWGLNFLKIFWGQILIKIWQTLNIINEERMFFKINVKEGFIK